MTPDPQPRDLVRELRAAELTTAVRLVSRGMHDNPLNVRAFGNDSQRRAAALERLFGIVVPMVLRKGVVLGTFRDGQLVGVAGMVRPGNCQAGTAEMIMLMPRLLYRLGFRSFGRLGAWLDEWKKHDPAEAHWHLGPVAVDAGLRGHGIGGSLMTEYCRRMDAAGTTGYLETDKPDNVKFYERFGFTTIAEANVLGVPNWFMIRRP